MTKLTLADAIILVVIALLICTAWVPAQSTNASISFASSGTQVSLTRFDASLFGSIGGRVFDERDTTAASPRGISGVRIIVRSEETGFGVIVAERISDAAGAYDFSNLRPGNYDIEIDPISVPAKFRAVVNPVSTVSVKAASRVQINVPITAQRSLTGIVYIDKDGDGQFKAGKDEPVAGAFVSVNGKFAVSDANGRYVLSELPAGRVGLLASVTKLSENTHVVLDLGDGPVTNRVVNVAVRR